MARNFFPLYLQEPFLYKILMLLNHDGCEFHDIDKLQYRYKGTIDVSPSCVTWTAELTLNKVLKESLKGTLHGIGEDDNTVRRAVDHAVKAAIQSLPYTPKNNFKMGS